MKHLILLLHLFVNAIFIYKYGARATSHFLPAAILYALGFAALFYSLPAIPERFFTRKTYILLALSHVVLVVAALQFIPQSSIRLDRHEMIALFWDNSAQGMNPYTPRMADSNIPSGLPFYFALAYPFHVMGEIGYLSLLGFVLFAVLLYRHDGFSLRAKCSGLVLLLASVAFNYEMVCRSTIFLNSVLALALVWAYRRYFKASRRSFAVLALASGLVLSTRSIVVVMLAPYFIHRFKWDFTLKSAGLFLGMAGAVFAATFLPFAFFGESYREYNPFAVQASAFLPMGAILAALALVIALSFLIKTENQYYGMVCLALIGLTAVYIALKTWEGGWTAAIFQNNADISYLAFCLPYLIFLTAARFSDEPRPAGLSPASR